MNIPPQFPCSIDNMRLNILFPSFCIFDRWKLSLQFSVFSWHDVLIVFMRLQLCSLPGKFDESLSFNNTLSFTSVGSLTLWMRQCGPLLEMEQKVLIMKEEELELHRQDRIKFYDVWKLVNKKYLGDKLVPVSSSLFPWWCSFVL